MDVEEATKTWERYSGTWTALRPEERGDILRKSLTDDVTFTSPDFFGRGLDGLQAAMVDFQRQLPRGYFDTKNLIAHNDQLLATWTMHDGEGAVVQSGQTYARFNAQGLIEHIAGFWQATD